MGSEMCIRDSDGHFGNEAEGDVPDDFATDVLSILGTGANDEILIGENNGQAAVFYNGTLIPVTALDSDGNLLVEQFRIAGLGGNDRIGFFSNEAENVALLLPSGSGLSPLDFSSIASTRDFIGVFDGNSGNDFLYGSSGRDRLDGGSGSDLVWGFAGDDRLWGDTGNGSTSDSDQLFAGQGNDDLSGGLGENSLFAWSTAPFGDDFGVFVDENGTLFFDDGDADGDGVLDVDAGLPVEDQRGPRPQESTGLNRILGSQQNDALYGGTVLDFLLSLIHI